MTFQSEAPLLSVRQIAHQFGLGQLSVRRYIASGQLKHVRIGGSVRVRVEDVQAFIDASTQKATA